METRIVRLLGMDQRLPRPQAAIVMLLNAGAAVGLFSCGVACAQRSEPDQATTTSTKRLVFDAHGSQYKRWLHQDVRWIIRPDEKESFLGLGNDQERDEFIRQFWVRRNPNPDSAENKFKEEHYRRLAYANTHFAVGEPGWQTDRGRVYIVFGPPDSIDSHPTSANGATKPFEIWHYQSIRVGWPPGRESWRHTVRPTIIENFDFKLVDECACGRFRLESSWPSGESGN